MKVTADDYRDIDFSKEPERYFVGRGEQGVLTAEPYRSILLPHWRFKTPDVAEESAKWLYAKFLEYLEADDFPGADLTRKFIQMGFTRSRRYARHRTGQKYVGPVPDEKKGQSGAHGREEAPLDPDPIKQQSAEVFKRYLDLVERHEEYIQQRAEWKARYG